MPKVSQGCETNKAHTDAHHTKSEWDSAVLEGLVRARYSAEMAVAVG